jgi:hypothetical protein
MGSECKAQSGFVASWLIKLRTHTTLMDPGRALSNRAHRSMPMRPPPLLRPETNTYRAGARRRRPCSPATRLGHARRSSPPLLHPAAQMLSWICCCHSRHARRPPLILLLIFWHNFWLPDRVLVWLVLDK